MIGSIVRPSPWARRGYFSRCGRAVLAAALRCPPASAHHSSAPFYDVVASIMITGTVRVFRLNRGDDHVYPYDCDPSCGIAIESRDRRE